MKNRHCWMIFLFLAFTLFEYSVFAQYSRDAWQQPEKIMDVVEIKPGMVIGEAGAGRGYFTFYLSERVGSTGKVYANDIDKAALRSIERRCERDSITNITTILGKEADPLFPAGELDMVIMMRAFHHFSDPVTWMKNVQSSMKSGAPLIIIDQDPDKAGEGWNHFMTKAQVLASMQKTDFVLDRIETFLERDNIYIFVQKDQEN